MTVDFYSDFVKKEMIFYLSFDIHRKIIFADYRAESFFEDFLDRFQNDEYSADTEFCYRFLIAIVNFRQFHNSETAADECLRRRKKAILSGRSIKLLP